MKQYAMDLEPDVLVLGFGMNDASVAGYRDKDMPGMKTERSAPRRIRSLPNEVECYRLLRYLATLFHYDPGEMGNRLKAAAEAPRGAVGSEEYEDLEEWTRVSLNDYETNMLEMIHRARNGGATVILLFNELWCDSPYRSVLERVATESGTPLVKSCSRIAEGRRRLEDDLERMLDLRPDAAPGNRRGEAIEVIFRVFMGRYPVANGVYIAGAHPELGNLRPNEVTMYDDGTHGDQRDGDNVWSIAAVLPPGIRIAYVYTNGGKRGRWEGLDVPDVRKFTIAAEGETSPIYRPIDTFGKIYLRSDSWHTDAEGYRLIAEALLEILEADANFKTFIDVSPSANP
jgi:lysophospholipase L1-like esterase